MWCTCRHCKSILQGEYPPPLPAVDGELVHADEHILGHTKIGQRKGKPLYKFLIKWEGFSVEHHSWEPESHLTGTCDTLLLPYKALHGL